MGENLIPEKWSELVAEVTSYLLNDGLDGIDRCWTQAEVYRYMHGKILSEEDGRHPLAVYWTTVNAMNSDRVVEHLLELYQIDNLLLFRLFIEQALPMRDDSEQVTKRVREEILNRPLPSGFDEEKRMPYGLLCSTKKGAEYIDWLITHQQTQPELMAKIIAEQDIHVYFNPKVAACIDDIGLLLRAIEEFNSIPLSRDFLVDEFNHTTGSWKDRVQYKYVINALRNAHVIQEARDARHKQEIDELKKAIAQRNAEILRLCIQP